MMILSVHIDDETEARLKHAANNGAGAFSPPDPMSPNAMKARLEWLAEALVSEGALEWAKKAGGPV